MNVNSTSTPLQDPAYVAARVAALTEGLKNGTNNDASSQTLWEQYGVEIQIAKDRAEGIELAKQGIPSKVWEFEGYTFIPAMLFNDLRDAKKREADAAKAAEAHGAVERGNLRLVEADNERLEFIKENNRLKSVADMLKTPEIEWMVKDKIHRTGLFQLYGASYAGKTVLTLDLIMSWCAGLPEWQGYKLNNEGKPQDAVYVAAEGGAAVSVHVDAWLKYHSDVDPSRLDGLLFLDGGEGDHMFLGIGKNQPEANDSIHRLAAEIDAAGINPSVMVFDTQIDLAPGIDENSNTDMVGVLREVKRLGDSMGFMAIVIHHTGHDGNQARGASGMKGKCDAQAKLTVIGSDKSGKAKLEWTKVKGRAMPKDSISYHIQGSALLPDLNSEGAVCVPIGAMEAAISVMTEIKPDDQTIYNFMSAVGQGEMSRSAFATAVGMDRNNKGFKDALHWMIWSKMLQETGEGRTKKISLAPFAVVPEDPSL